MDKKIWMITGVSSGLGKALAARAMASGAYVVGTLRQEGQQKSFDKAHRGSGHALCLDITDEEAVEEAVRATIAAYGRIDVLANNAGVGFAGAVEEASMAEARAVFEANVFGALRMTQAVLPHMRQARAGQVVQVSSHGGTKAFAGFGIYNASKFALEGFSEALALEVAPLGIQVGIVAPGPFRTNFAGKGLRVAAKAIGDYADTAGAFRQKLKNADGKQEGDPDKAAQAIVDWANAGMPTLRLPLGKTALATMAMKLESVKNDLAANKAVAEGTAY